MKLRDLQLEEVTFHFEPLLEDECPEYHFDQLADEGICEEIRTLGARGDLPHPKWFCAQVWVTWGDFKSESQFLGCCSFESYDEFQHDGYDRDLKYHALDSLQKKVEECFKDIQRLVTLNNGMPMEDVEGSLNSANFWGTPVELLFQSNELDRIADVFQAKK